MDERVNSTAPLDSHSQRLFLLGRKTGSFSFRCVQETDCVVDSESEGCRWCLREEETIIHMFSTCKGLAKLRREQDIKDQTVLSLNEMESPFFFRSAVDLLEASNGEHLEELRRSEDIEDAIAAGAVTVRRKKT